MQIHLLAVQGSGARVEREAWLQATDLRRELKLDSPKISNHLSDLIVDRPAAMTPVDLAVSRRSR